MAKAATLLKQLKDIKNDIDSCSRDQYTYARDSNGDLHVKFGDGDRYKFPIVPYRYYQKEIRDSLFVLLILRILICWPRRSGKELGTWQMIIESCIEYPGTYLMIYPNNNRARAVLWDGNVLINDEMVPFIKMIPERFIEKVSNTEMKVHWTNGSVIWVLGSDIDVDKLRGTNPRGIVFSEFAYSDPRVFYTMMPALRQSKGWLIGQSTFRGMNHFYRLMQRNKEDPLWKCDIESVETLLDKDGNRFITDEMIDEDRRAGMPEELIQQEYYSNVHVNESSRWFSNAMKSIYETNRIIDGLYIPDSPAYTAWDLGVNDLNTMIIFQVNTLSGIHWPVIIGYFETQGNGYNEDIDLIRKFSCRYNISILKHFHPHDGGSRHKTDDGAKRSPDFMRDLGELCETVKKPNNKVIAIESMRRMLNRCTFNTENCQVLIDRISSYSKEFDDKMGVYKDKELHDLASHGVAAFQTMTIAIDLGLIPSQSYGIVSYV